MLKNCALAVAAGLLVAPAAAQDNLLDNPSFENSVFGVVTNWENFTTNALFVNTVEELAPLDGDVMVQAYGGFWGGACAYQASLVQQGAPDVTDTIPVTPGVTYEASVWAYERSADPMDSTPSVCNPADPKVFWVLTLGFFDAAGNEIGGATPARGNPGEALDRWTEYSTQATAPAGAVRAVYSLVLLQPDAELGGGTGSIFWDNASLAAVEDEPSCPADFDGNGAANVNDLLGFLGAFRVQGPGSDFDGNGSVNVNDLLGFLGAFRNGCPQ